MYTILKLKAKAGLKPLPNPTQNLFFQFAKFPPGQIQMCVAAVVFLVTHRMPVI
jgi:hypothetical protein